MVKKLTLSLLATALLSSSLFAKADKALVDTYMEVSGATKTLESLSSQITGSMAQTSMMYGEKVDAKKVAFLEKVFSHDENIQQVRAYLTEHFNNSQLQKIIAFDKSQIGSEFVDAGVDAMQADLQAQMLRFMASLQENPPSQERINTIKKLNSTLQSDETMKVIFSELMNFFMQEEDTKGKVSQEQLSQMMAMMDQALEQQMFISSLFVYRNLSDKELQKVMDFYQSDAGKSEISVLRDALAKMLKDGFKRAM